MQISLGQHEKALVEISSKNQEGDYMLKVFQKYMISEVFRLLSLFILYGLFDAYLFMTSSILAYILLVFIIATFIFRTFETIKYALSIKNQDESKICLISPKAKDKIIRCNKLRFGKLLYLVQANENVEVVYKPRGENMIKQTMKFKESAYYEISYVNQRLIATKLDKS